MMKTFDFFLLNLLYIEFVAAWMAAYGMYCLMLAEKNEAATHSISCMNENYSLNNIITFQSQYHLWDWNLRSCERDLRHGTANCVIVPNGRSLRKKLSCSISIFYQSENVKCRKRIAWNSQHRCGSLATKLFSLNEQYSNFFKIMVKYS